MRGIESKSHEAAKRTKPVPIEIWCKPHEHWRNPSAYRHIVSTSTALSQLNVPKYCRHSFVRQGRMTNSGLVPPLIP